MYYDFAFQVKSSYLYSLVSRCRLVVLMSSQGFRQYVQVTSQAVQWRELTTSCSGLKGKHVKASNDSAACSGQCTWLEYTEEKQTESNTSSKKHPSSTFNQTLIPYQPTKSLGAPGTPGIESDEDPPPTPPGAPNGPLAFVQHQVAPGKGLARGHLPLLSGLSLA